MTSQDPWLGGKLTAHLKDNGPGGLADGIDAEGGEDKGKKTADQQSRNHARIGKIEDDFHRAVCIEFLDVGAEQNQGGESRRCDGITLRDGFHCVSDSIQGVGDFPSALRRLAHHGNAPGVVGDRAEGVE